MGMSLVLLGACAGGTKPPSQPMSAPQASSKPAPPREFPREAVVQRLLAQADAAFERGRYTTPMEDNAFDQYQAVLMLDPGNKEAQSGLDGVLLAYMDHVRAVMAAGQLSSARELLKRAETYFADAPLLQELRAEVKQAQAVYNEKREELARQDILNGEKILLPELELSRRGEDVVAILTALAQRVQDSKESVLIMARNDSEGRWIYKEMQEAVKGHRIRGDIRISRVPAVVLMAPL